VPRLPFPLLRRLLSPLLAVALAGCALAPPRLPPTTVPPEKVQRVVALALAHWQRWGAREARLARGDAPLCLLQPDGGCATVDDGCGDERSAALCPRVDDYWRAVPPFEPRHDCRTTDRCVLRWPADAPEPPAWTPAWSAAFVSALLREAGFSQTEFRADEAHVRYVVAARDGQASAFELLTLPAQARPGDLACALRGRAAWTEAGLAGLNDGRPGTTMHCDIVVAVDPSARSLQAVGGNVQQTVARTTVDLDDAGRLSADINPHGRWVLLMRPRLAPPA
jgi:hypothetical protein